MVGRISNQRTSLSAAASSCFFGLTTAARPTQQSDCVSEGLQIFDEVVLLRARALKPSVQVDGVCNEVCPRRKTVAMIEATAGERAPLAHSPENRVCCWDEPFVGREWPEASLPNANYGEAVGITDERK
jgi:hypothetical protein